MEQAVLSTELCNRAHTVFIYNIQLWASQHLYTTEILQNRRISNNNSKSGRELAGTETQSSVCIFGLFENQVFPVITLCSEMSLNLAATQCMHQILLVIQKMEEHSHYAAKKRGNKLPSPRDVTAAADRWGLLKKHSRMNIKRNIFA